MFAGNWQGTMALTEPQAGSSLTDLKTTAFPQADGSYKIKGQKIFISCADYESTENVVNLLLARIDGAPPGIKGISLFVVPKNRPDGRGGLTGNDVACMESTTSSATAAPRSPSLPSGTTTTAGAGSSASPTRDFAACSR